MSVMYWVGNNTNKNWSHDANWNSEVGLYPGDGTAPSGDVQASLSSGWQYYQQIVVSSVKEVTGIDENLYDFPLLIAHSGNAHIGEYAQSNGNDIRFTLSDGTALDFEKDFFVIEDDLAKFAYWVRIPVVDSDVRPEVICWYGNPAAAAWDGDPADVWTPSGYRGVWHFRDGSLANSANADKPLSAVGSPTFLAGGGPFAWMDAYQVGGANRFTLADALGLSLPLTLSGWGSFATTSYEPRFLDLRAGTSHHRRSLYMVSSNTIRVQGNTPTTFGFVAIGMTLDQWNKWDGAFHATNLRRGYKDGALAGTNTTDVAGIDPPDNITIGEVNCKVAEVRYANVARSAAWLKFEYENMASEYHRQNFFEEQPNIIGDCVVDIPIEIEYFEILPSYSGLLLVDETLSINNFILDHNSTIVVSGQIDVINEVVVSGFVLPIEEGRFELNNYGNAVLDDDWSDLPHIIFPMNCLGSGDQSIMSSLDSPFVGIEPQIKKSGGVIHLENLMTDIRGYDVGDYGLSVVCPSSTLSIEGL